MVTNKPPNIIAREQAGGSRDAIRRKGVLFLFPALISACHGNPDRNVGGQAAPLEIEVRFEAPETCKVIVAGEAFALPLRESELQHALKLRRKSTSTARIEADPAIPYKCIGLAVFLVQGGGFQVVKAGPIPMR